MNASSVLTAELRLEINLRVLNLIFKKPWLFVFDLVYLKYQDRNNNNIVCLETFYQKLCAFPYHESLCSQ